MNCEKRENRYSESASFPWSWRSRKRSEKKIPRKRDLFNSENIFLYILFSVSFFFRRRSLEFYEAYFHSVYREYEKENDTDRIVRRDSREIQIREIDMMNDEYEDFLLRHIVHIVFISLETLLLFFLSTLKIEYTFGIYFMLEWESHYNS